MKMRYIRIEALIFAVFVGSWMMYQHGSAEESGEEHKQEIRSAGWEVIFMNFTSAPIKVSLEKHLCMTKKGNLSFSLASNAQRTLNLEYDDTHQCADADKSVTWKISDGRQITWMHTKIKKDWKTYFSSASKGVAAYCGTEGMEGGFDCKYPNMVEDDYASPAEVELNDLAPVRRIP